MNRIMKSTALLGVIAVCLAIVTPTLADEPMVRNLGGLEQQFLKTDAQPQILLAVMSEEMKKKPKEIDPGTSGGNLCMEKYRRFYENYGRRNAPPPPEGTNPSCQRCLSDRADAGRPYSDAVRYCKSRCDCK
jgi:hypothetical protein